MTSDEIIKSLQEATLYREVCQDDEEIVTAIVKQDFLKDVLVLVCRQKAKIEALTMDNNQLQSDIVNANCNYEEIKEECERLKKEQAQFADIGKMYSEIKAEAIEEFAEKFQTRMQDLARIDNNGLPLFLVSEKFIDDFVKEKVGENNGI